MEQHSYLSGGISAVFNWTVSGISDYFTGLLLEQFVLSIRLLVESLRHFSGALW